MEKIRNKINGSLWPIMVSVLLTANGFFLANVMFKTNKIYDTVIENKTKADNNSKRLDRIESLILKIEK